MTGTPLGSWPAQRVAEWVESIGLDSAVLAAFADRARVTGHAGALTDLALERA
ncbi:hypothetical protein AB6O49_01305 [Streptomyces sp. SBR177]